MPHRDFSLSVAQWLHALKTPDARYRAVFGALYGDSGNNVEQRLGLMRNALRAFAKAFGDRPVRVFRAPGRINLRGMHVDTHGGYLNLMTHQREIAVVAAVSETAESTFVNADPQFPRVVVEPRPLQQARSGFSCWQAFIDSGCVRQAVAAQRGGWANYLLGACVRAGCVQPEQPLRGIDAVVASDLPIGASLSSSAALCVAVTQALLAHNGLELEEEALILAARDAEWLTGARTGTGDQTAVVCGRRNQILHCAVLTEDFSLAGARHVPFPEALDLLVINSYTGRSLSGAGLAAYTANRFAYSIAMDVLRQEMRHCGYSEEQVRHADRLSRLSAPALGGVRRVYTLLGRIPERISLEDLRTRYPLEDLDGAYNRYFSNVAEADRPREVALRGPLLYGLAESERARRFPELLEQGSFEEAGRLMCLGHDGDRVARCGHPVPPQGVSEETLAQFAAEGVPLSENPGVYGASSPVMDALVDIACAAGALGACLTGAGIAGAVLALCRKEATPQVRAAVQEFLEREQGLNAQQLAEAVVINHAPGGACELPGP